MFQQRGGVVIVTTLDGESEHVISHSLAPVRRVCSKYARAGIDRSAGLFCFRYTVGTHIDFAALLGSC